MTPEQLRSTARLMVEYIRARAEFVAVRSLFTTYMNLRNPVPATWERDLAAMRELPPYRTFLDSFEPEMSQALQDASESSLTALLNKIDQSNRVP